MSLLRGIALRDVDPELREPLEIVLKDVGGTGAPMPLIDSETWADESVRASAVLRGPVGSAGVAVTRGRHLEERVAELAETLQEWVSHELLRLDRPTSWPPCPVHPDSHPMDPEVRAGVAVWSCPVTDRPQAAIGALRA